jgi:MEDS: MEthanogen/methylotroph, DcmR Sensory domain
VRRNAFHTIDPHGRDEHLQRLASAGIDVTATLASGQLEVHDWNEMHLRDGLFDQSRTLAGWEQIERQAKQDGFPLIRFVAHMEWAFEDRPGVGDLLEYEARANYLWLRFKGPIQFCHLCVRSHKVRWGMSLSMSCALIR